MKYKMTTTKQGKSETFQFQDTRTAIKIFRMFIGHMPVLYADNKIILWSKK